MKARQNVGLAVFVATAIIAGLGTALLGVTGGWDARAVLTAARLSAAITFTYGTVLPPFCAPSVQRISDRETGKVDDRHESRISLVQGVPTPLRFVVFNTGIATAGFRVTLNFGGDELRVSREHAQFPNALCWEWNQGEVAQVAPRVFLLSRPGPLTAGEPIVTSPIVEGLATGFYELVVVVACTGHFGETFATLPILVTAHDP